MQEAVGMSFGKNMKRWSLLFGVFVLLLLLNFSSAVSRDEYRDFLKNEIVDYFDGENTSLELSELKIAVNYYFESSGDVVDLGGSGLSSDSVFVINSLALGSGNVSSGGVCGNAIINYYMTESDVINAGLCAVGVPSVITSSVAETSNVNLVNTTQWSWECGSGSQAKSCWAYEKVADSVGNLIISCHGNDDRCPIIGMVCLDSGYCGVWDSS